MIDLERRLLFRLTTPEGMAQAIGADLRPEVFEFPLNNAACNWAMQYWAEYEMAPPVGSSNRNSPASRIPTLRKPPAG